MPCMLYFIVILKAITQSLIRNFLNLTVARPHLLRKNLKNIFCFPHFFASVDLRATDTT